jgi:rhodanese-related sulfurtransferase
MFHIFKSNKGYESISPQEAKKLLDTNKDVLLIDVRTPDEFRKSRIAKSVSVPLDTLMSNIEKVAPNKDAIIIMYCHSGLRSSTACRELVKMGYTDVRNLGGIFSWHYGTISDNA